MNNFSEIKRPSSNFNQSGNLMSERMKMELPKFQAPRQKINKNFLGFLGGLGALVIASVLGILILILYFGGVFSRFDLDKNKGEWQAVFLDNGEVYFGKVAAVNDEVVIMNNIFYLQNKEALQQGAQTKNQNSDINLIKLGNELHGPKDEMRINKGQVFFVEDMKDDSKIVKAIKDYLAK